MKSFSWPDDDVEPGKRVVLITGSREWRATDFYRIRDVLSLVMPQVVIHGGARGADYAAHMWCLDNYARVREEVFNVLWNGHKGDYLTRNQAMVDRAKKYMDNHSPSLCVAFPLPGSRGTIDCMDRAIYANIPTLEYH